MMKKPIIITQLQHDRKNDKKMFKFDQIIAKMTKASHKKYLVAWSHKYSGQIWQISSNSFNIVKASIIRQN